MKIKLVLFVVSILLPMSIAAQEVKKAERTTTDPVLVSLQNKIRTQQGTIDSLVLLIMTKAEQGSIITDLDEVEKLTEDEVKLGKLALKLDQKLFEVFNKESEVDEIRKYFLSKFSANFVTIDKGGNGSIAIVTHENLGEHLGSIQADKHNYKITNIDFLDTKVAGNVFNMAYKTVVEASIDGKLDAELSILTTLTGRRVDHLWKIGSYSSTSIAFEKKED